MRNAGPGPMHRSETASAAAPAAATPGRSFGAAGYKRPLAGLLTVALVAAIFGLAVQLFRGELFSDTVPVTVVAERAGLVMNADAKVKMRDVEVGRVSSIEELPDGRAAIHLALDPAEIDSIPGNVDVNVAASTVFGAKYVQLLPPAEESGQRLRAGQVVTAEHVTVEINTLFQQLNTLVSAIEPTKLNTTLTALATALSGRGERLGQALTNMERFLAELDPSLQNLGRDIAAAPVVLNTYADVTPDLMRVLANSTKLSESIVDQQANLDRFLVSVIGVSGTANDVIGGNRQGLSDTLRLLVPTTDLLNRYHPALNCLLSGLIPLTKAPPLRLPGAEVSTGFTWGVERYRYPQDLPKVAAKGGPQCAGLPVPFEKRPPYLVADTGANPYRYGNSGIVLNSDGLKQLLFGPIDGPPRNSMQIGQPG
ncbi:MCE family protein [Mycobacterium deserti]|uniref:MCE family protein n=1 Tax=Mycobacterium deserti TaxID=2978347 RepID=A0ABT2MGT4_9MYCO|nr:MCE family protein [Mycobacterium deserti]MCT7661196.1 MCE family protein [Mycobacterium deserti]